MEKDPRTQFLDLWDETIYMFDILKGDLDKTIYILEEKMRLHKNKPASTFFNEIEPWIRMSIRIVFSTIEAICFRMKQAALMICQLKRLPLSEKDKENINEMTEDGTRHYLKTPENVKYSFKIFSYALGRESPIEFDKNWFTFISLSEKRNELTHPKSLEDLKVTPQQHNDSAECIKWFFDLLGKIRSSLPG